MNLKKNTIKLMGAASLLAMAAALAPVQAVEGEKAVYHFDIKAQPLAKALLEYSRMTSVVVSVRSDLVASKTSPEISGSMSAPEALSTLLKGTGLNVVEREDGSITIRAPQKVSQADIQPSAMGASTSSEDEVSFVLEEIIVTATRRSENLQDVALSISALSSAEMERRGIEGFGDFARQLPGVVVTENVKHFGKFTIRGLQDSTTTSGSSNKTVTVYVDDIPVTSLAGATPDMRLYDVERVEVLRGPQGTLFGSNSLGGAVRIITNKPNLEAFDASVGVDFGLTGSNSFRQRYNGMVNVPVVQGELAFRVVGYYRQEDGFVDNALTNEENVDDSKEWGFRTSAKWMPSDRFSANLMLMKDESEVIWSAQDPSFGHYQLTSLWDDGVDMKSSQYSLAMDYEFDWATLTSITTLSDVHYPFELNLNQIIPDILPVGFYSNLQSESTLQELRLVSAGDSPVSWVLGGFYLDTKRRAPVKDGLLTTTDFLDDLGVTGLLENRVPGSYDLSEGASHFDVEEIAVYGELSWQFTETLKLTAGGRYTKSQIAQERVGGYDALGPVIGAILGGDTAIDINQFTTDNAGFETDKVSKFTKKLNLTWQPDDNQTYYIMAAEGFRLPFPNPESLVNGGASTIDPTDPIIIPTQAASDSLWNYEIGAKTIWLDGRLTVNLAAYYIDWTNIQLSLTRASDGVPYKGNAGSAVSKGIEAEIQVQPSQGLSLGMNMTIQNAKITELSDEEALSTGAVKGARLASPNFQMAGHVQYRWALTNGMDMYARVDAQHIGSHPNGFPNLVRSGDPNPFYATIPSYENVNMSIGLQSDNWTLVLYGENVLDNDNYIAINPNTITSNRFSTLRPRTVGIRASWKY